MVGRQLLRTMIFGLFSIRAATGHHGAAGYDMESLVTLKASVTNFRWANPHAVIEFEVDETAGGNVQWMAETAAPVMLTRAGWDKNALTSGEKVSIIGHPAKNGSHTMILQSITKSDGRVLSSYLPAK